MRIIHEGVANKHDLVHVTCKHCGTNVTFWRGEPGTKLDYVGTYDDGSRFRVSWTCPVCHLDEEVFVNHINPIYNDVTEAFDGVEKDRILTVKEKAEMEEALKE